MAASFAIRQSETILATVGKSARRASRLSSRAVREGVQKVSRTFWAAGQGHKTAATVLRANVGQSDNERRRTLCSTSPIGAHADGDGDRQKTVTGAKGTAAAQAKKGRREVSDRPTGRQHRANRISPPSVAAAFSSAAIESKRLSRNKNFLACGADTS
jgi:hypothetical protein